ncbi:hypothetical protein BDQ17DRAFT_1331218 [Cyathus striatus]|nr:hypothetical protein BDQ17DRAFT_1331218 [Cyathus striatus]
MSLCIIVAILIVGIKFQVKDFSGVDLHNSFSTRNADLISVDAMASTLLMRWYIKDDSCIDDNRCKPVYIYFDTLLNSNSGDVDQMKQGKYLPSFTWYRDQLNYREGLSYPHFDTTSSLFDDGTKKSHTSTQNYPFDIYGVSFQIYGLENTTDIVMFNGVNILVDYTYGAALTHPGISGFETTSYTKIGDYIPGGMYINHVSLRRSNLIKAYVVSIIIGILMKILFGYSQPKEALTVPIATLFAFTSLRGTMPGAPGFGTVMGN